MAVRWLTLIIFGILWAQRLAVLKIVILSSFPHDRFWGSILKEATLMDFLITPVLPFTAV
jgi:hypothetical protein